MSPILTELIVIVSMCLSLPALVMAAWHGWKFEQYRAEQERPSEEEA